MASLKPLLLAVPLCVRPALGKDAFVFLGATGDNALRPNGVWQGVFEAFTGGEFDKVGGLDMHVAMNTPHSVDELRTKVNETLAPFYDDLKTNPGWQCKTVAGDCSVANFVNKITVNIWEGRDANAQAVNMTQSLQPYERITVYLSIPPSVFGAWSDAAIKNWGEGAKNRVHVAAEKPFGTSLESADKLHQDILGPGLPDSNLHLVDHWLSFFMNRHLMELRALILPRLKMSAGASGKWDASTFSRVVVTEHEERGLDGRGGFFDTVGQTRDMVQSHLLQVMALALLDTSIPETGLDEAKLALFNSTTVSSCAFGQYDGFLLEPKLTYHSSYADSTYVEVQLGVNTEAWRGVPVTIATGKTMGATIYTVDFFQKDGPGVLTFEIGKEETGLGGIKVKDWELTDTSAFDAPAPGFSSGATIKAQPAVTAGNGFFLNYSSPSLYFPKPYALMAASLLTRQYGAAFVAYPQCRRSWEIVTAAGAAVCLDPPPAKVQVYKAPQTCGNTPPAVCFEDHTVEYMYDVAFSCTPEHNIQYKTISLYDAKCNVSAGASDVVFI